MKRFNFIERFTRIFLAAVLVLSTLPLQAQLRAPALVVTTSQPVLTCRSGSCKSDEAWSQYDRSHPSEGQLEQQQTYRWDGEIEVPQSESTTWLQAGTAQSPPKRKQIDFSTIVHDPSNNSDVPVSSSDLTPQQSNDLLKMAGNAATAAINTKERFDQIDRQSERLRDSYEQMYANQKAAANALASRAQDLREQLAHAARDGRVQTASYLAMLPIPKTLSPEDFRSRQRAQQTARDPLAERHYELNATANEATLEQIDRAIGRKNFEALVGQLEKVLHQKDQTQRAAAVRQVKSYVNSEGVLKTSRFQMPAGPFESTKFQTSFTSGEGEVVRRVANRYQAVWGETNGLQGMHDGQKSQFLTGAAFLAAGDRALARGERELGSRYVAFSDALIDGIYGFSVGAEDSAVELIHSIPAFAKIAKSAVVAFQNDPRSALTSAEALIYRLPSIAGKIALDIYHDYDQLIKGDAYERGKVLGKFAVQAAVNEITGGMAKAASAAVESAVAIAERGAIEAAAATTEEIFAEAAQASPVYRQAVIEVEKRASDIAIEIAGEHAARVAAGQNGTAEYLERYAASGQNISSAAEVTETAERHAAIESADKTVQGATYEGPVSRAIYKKTTADGVELTETDVMKIPPKNYAREHRYSIGGPLGQEALYTAEGRAGDVEADLMKEIHASSRDEIITATKNVKVDNMLDLTNEAVRKSLGVSVEELRRDKYNVTQMLGDVAQRNGRNGLIVPSADGTTRNLIFWRGL